MRNLLSQAQFQCRSLFGWTKCIAVSGPIGSISSIANSRAVGIPESLERASAKRQREFIVGRYCSSIALDQLLGASGGRVIGIGNHREPLWPQNVVGSISHSDTHALAVVARQDDAASLGVDIENWIEQKSAAELIPLITSSASETNLLKARSFTETQALTLIFSAKESLFKCLFPLVQEYFGFNDATITFIDPNLEYLTIRLDRSLSDAMQNGRTFMVHTLLSESGVTTGVIISDKNKYSNA
jgi:enterobactin synthetase component D